MVQVAASWGGRKSTRGVDGKRRPESGARRDRCIGARLDDLVGATGFLGCPEHDARAQTRAALWRTAAMAAATAAAASFGINGGKAARMTDSTANEQGEGFWAGAHREEHKSGSVRA